MARPTTCHTFARRSVVAVSAAMLTLALFPPAAARAQHRTKLENRESEWSLHRYGANAESVVVSRDGTRSVVVASRDGLLYVVDGIAPPPDPSDPTPRPAPLLPPP